MDIGKMYSSGHANWVRALEWDRESKYRSMPQTHNPYRPRKIETISGSKLFFKRLEQYLQVEKLLGWTYYSKYWSESLEIPIRQSHTTEAKRWDSGWYKYKRGNGVCCFVNFYKYTSQTINLKIGFTRERDRKKGVMKEFCNEIIFPLVDEINQLFNRNGEYEGLLVSSRLQIICTANPLICLNFPDTKKEEEEWDFSRDIDEFYWGLYDESMHTLDHTYVDTPRLTQQEADDVWEAIGFTPDPSKKTFISIGSFGGKSEQSMLMKRSKDIGRFPKVYPKIAMEEQWPANEPDKKKEKKSEA
jgi:hypothetical protein